MAAGADYFWRKAGQCRRLASGLPNQQDPAVAALLALGLEFEAEALALGADGETEAERSCAGETRGRPYSGRGHFGEHVKTLVVGAALVLFWTYQAQAVVLNPGDKATTTMFSFSSSLGGYYTTSETLYFTAVNPVAPGAHLSTSIQEITSASTVNFTVDFTNSGASSLLSVTETGSPEFNTGNISGSFAVDYLGGSGPINLDNVSVKEFFSDTPGGPSSVLAQQELPVTTNAAAVLEPASLLLLANGLGGMALLRWWNRFRRPGSSHRMAADLRRQVEAYASELGHICGARAAEATVG